MADLKISELTQRTPDGTEYMEVIISPFTTGTNRKVLVSELAIIFGSSSYRGDYAGGTAFPSSGGTLSGGVPAAGNRWRLTGTLTIGGTDVYGAGTIIEAAINTPGQTTSNWIKYAVQS